MRTRYVDIWCSALFEVAIVLLFFATAVLPVQIMRGTKKCCRTNFGAETKGVLVELLGAVFASKNQKVTRSGS